MTTKSAIKLGSHGGGPKKKPPKKRKPTKLKKLSDKNR